MPGDFKFKYKFKKAISQAEILALEKDVEKTNYTSSQQDTQRKTGVFG